MGAMGTNQTFEELGGERKGREGTRLHWHRREEHLCLFFIFSDKGLEHVCKPR